MNEKNDLVMKKGLAMKKYEKHIFAMFSTVFIQNITSNASKTKHIVKFHNDFYFIIPAHRETEYLEKIIQCSDGSHVFGYNLRYLDHHFELAYRQQKRDREEKQDRQRSRYCVVGETVCIVL